MRGLQEKIIQSQAGAPRLPETTEGTFPSSRHLKWAITILMVYFGLKLLFFSITISPYVPPDESTHYAKSMIFSETFFMPENSDETYEYGLVTNIPWLYYWIMGKILTLNIFGMPDILFLRLMNIPLAFASVYFVWRLLRLLTDDRLSQLLLIVAMTNTLMFTFLSAFVTYDNLANLLAAMAIYYLFAFLKSRSGDLLVISLLCQMVGSLTKVTLLPLFLALNVLLVIHEFKNIRQLPGALSTYFKPAAWRRFGLALGIFIALALNIQLYGVNYYHYGSLSPEMHDVLSHDKAMQDRLTARNLIFSDFKEGRISKEEALAMASQIKHPGDRFDTIYLIDNYSNLKKNNLALSGPLKYTAFWIQHMSAGIFGIFGHFQMFNTGPTIWPIAALGILTGIAIVIRWRPSDADWIPTSLMTIVAFYALFLLCFVSYPAYLDTGEISLLVQGRYLFPVLGALYAVSSYYLPRLFLSGRPRLILSVGACIIFIVSDFPYFLAHVDADWFVPLFD